MLCARMCVVCAGVARGARGVCVSCAWLRESVRVVCVARGSRTKDCAWYVRGRSQQLWALLAMLARRGWDKLKVVLVHTAELVVGISGHQFITKNITPAEARLHLFLPTSSRTTTPFLNRLRSQQLLLFTLRARLRMALRILW
jgi:hypothetical protein